MECISRENFTKQSMLADEECYVLKMVPEDIL